MDRLIHQWLERVKYDLETARGMIKIRKYLYAAFMCQQTLEKLLKAVIVSQGKTPLPIHNLPRLAQEADFWDECESRDPGFLAELTPFCVKARYGEYKRRLSELCNAKTAKNYLERTEKMNRWLTAKIK